MVVASPKNLFRLRQCCNLSLRKVLHCPTHLCSYEGDMHKMCRNILIYLSIHTFTGFYLAVRAHAACLDISDIRALRCEPFVRHGVGHPFPAPDRREGS